MTELLGETQVAGGSPDAAEDERLLLTGNVTTEPARSVDDRLA